MNKITGHNHSTWELKKVFVIIHWISFSTDKEIKLWPNPEPGNWSCNPLLVQFSNLMSFLTSSLHKLIKRPLILVQKCWLHLLCCPKAYFLKYIWYQEFQIRHHEPCKQQAFSVEVLGLQLYSWVHLLPQWLWISYLVPTKF